MLYSLMCIILSHPLTHSLSHTITPPVSPLLMAVNVLVAVMVTMEEVTVTGGTRTPHKDSFLGTQTYLHSDHTHADNAAH